MLQIFKKKKPETHIHPKFVREKILGDIFKLPFGKYIVMNHWTDDMVYIDNVRGEGINTFTQAYDKLTEAIAYGAIIPPQIKVICVCKLELEGSYLQLEAIVKQIRRNEN